MTSCQNQQVNIPAEKLDGPPINSGITSIAWLPTGQIVAESEYQLWYRSQSSDKWIQLTIADDVCHGHGYFQLTLLPDQRLGMLCSAGLKDQKILRTMVAYDWRSNALTPIVSSTLPDAGQFSWKPDMTKGVFATIGSYSTLYWLTYSGVKVVPVTLVKDSKTWTFADSLVALDQYNQSSNRTGRELDPVGLVRDPAWSPDGKHIVFWATLETIGRPFNFPIVPWDIYMLDPDTLQVDRILENVMDPTVLGWSPNSEWLLYLSSQGDTQPQGIWLFSLRTRESTLISKGQYSDATWSPDGHSVLGVQCIDELCKSTQIWKYDISTVVNSAK